MPRGYRNIGAAVAGIAALASAIGVGWTAGVLNYPQEERYQSYRDASDKLIRPQTPALGKETAQPLQYRTPCSEPNGRDESDLCAQWKAARAAEGGTLWAERGFWVSFGSLVLSVGGLGALLVTIRQGREAIAKANDANEISRQSLEWQTRAYVRIDVVEGGDFRIGQKARINCKVVNYGATVARDFSVTSAICIREPGWAWENDPHSNVVIGERGSSVFHPGEERLLNFEMQTPLSAELYSRIKLGSLVIYARGSAIYSTIHGTKCFSRIAVEFSGDECFRSGAPRIALYGNDAT